MGILELVNVHSMIAIPGCSIVANSFFFSKICGEGDTGPPCPPGVLPCHGGGLQIAQGRKSGDVLEWELLRACPIGEE